MSATTLIAPRKVRILTARHYDDIVVDAEGEGHSLFGEAMHYVVSKAQDSSYICEERKYVNIDGKILTGKPDLYDKILNVIEDYKTKSVWTYVFNKEDWEKQLNIYAFLIDSDLYPVKGLLAVVYFKDWYESEKLKFSNYPEFNPFVFNVPLWTREEREKYVISRMKYHTEVEELEDDDIPECTQKNDIKTTTHLLYTAKQTKQEHIEYCQRKNRQMYFVQI
jgi:hypothetical protein